VNKPAHSDLRRKGDGMRRLRAHAALEPGPQCYGRRAHRSGPRRRWGHPV